MIVLDTNVLSEAPKAAPAGTVLSWLAAQAPSEVFITTGSSVWGHRGFAGCGRRVPQSDAMIAAFARSYRAPVAARNRSGFEGCGIRVIDPGSVIMVSASTWRIAQTATVSAWRPRSRFIPANVVSEGLASPNGKQYSFFVRD